MESKSLFQLKLIFSRKKTIVFKKFAKQKPHLKGDRPKIKITYRFVMV